MISSMSVAAKPLDAYQTETRFGPGYELITSTYAGICSESLYFPEAVVSGTCTNSAGFSDNTCGAYNALMTFEWSRSCSLVYTGDQRDGFGFRDTVQDCLGVTSMIPQEVRERLILMLSAQDATGGAEPEVRPWSHSPGHMPATPASHYRSDDCLKLGYKGESVFVAIQLRLALKTYAEITASLSPVGEQAWAESELSALDANIAAVCWDGDWFIWAFAEDGTVFGTKNYPEGQVYLNTQAWAVLSGAASDERMKLQILLSLLILPLLANAEDPYRHDPEPLDSCDRLLKPLKVGIPDCALKPLSFEPYE
jgi:hypothetical protein